MSLIKSFTLQATQVDPNGNSQRKKEFTALLKQVSSFDNGLKKLISRSQNIIACPRQLHVKLSLWVSWKNTSHATSHFPLPTSLAHLTSDFKRFLHFYPRCHAVLWWPILGTEKAGKWPAVVRGWGGGGSGCWWLEAAWLVNWLMHYIIKMYDFSLRNSKSVLGQSKQREKNVDSLMFSQAYVVKF